MVNRIILLNEYEYSASIPDTPIPYRQIRKAVIGLQALQNGTTAPTILGFLQELSEIQFSAKKNYFNGIKIDGEDLFAINVMLLGHVPEIVKPNGNDQAIYVAPIYVPLGINTDITPSYHFFHSDDTKTDTHKITLGIDLGVGEEYEYYKKNDTADTIGTEVDMSQVGKRLKALLVYATTIPTTSGFGRSIKELKIIVNKQEAYHYNWFELSRGLAPINALVNADVGGILDNYRIITFTQPIPANDLTVWTKSDSATDTIEFLGVYV